jgi:hypothetical protein
MFAASRRAVSTVLATGTNTTLSRIVSRPELATVDDSIRASLRQMVGRVALVAVQVDEVDVGRQPMPQEHAAQRHAAGEMTGHPLLGGANESKCLLRDDSSVERFEVKVEGGDVLVGL